MSCVLIIIRKQLTVRLSKLAFLDMDCKYVKTLSIKF